MEAFLELLLDRLRDKPRSILFYLLLGIALVVSVLGMIDTVFNIYEAFEDRTILWILGMLGALVIIGASLSVLRESRAQKVGGMGMIARRLLRGAVLLVAAAVFGFVGYHIGQALQGSPAAPLALAVGLMAIAGIWWSTRTQR